MYKVCNHCEFTTETMSQTVCPTCGEPLRFTMLPPSRRESLEDDASETPADFALSQGRAESLELPMAVRITQIGTGIFIFLSVSRWGTRILAFLVGSAPTVQTTGQAVYLAAYTIFFYIAASLAGGAVAGAYSVNWIPQGVGVGLGVLAIPLLLLILFLPSSLPLYLLGVAATTGFTVLGAYLGHRLIRPSQFIS